MHMSILAKMLRVRIVAAVLPMAVDSMAAEVEIFMDSGQGGTVYRQSKVFYTDNIFFKPRPCPSPRRPCQHLE